MGAVAERTGGAAAVTAAGTGPHAVLPLLMKRALLLAARLRRGGRGGRRAVHRRHAVPTVGRFHPLVAERALSEATPKRSCG